MRLVTSVCPLCLLKRTYMTLLTGVQRTSTESDHRVDSLQWPRGYTSFITSPHAFPWQTRGLRPSLHYSEGPTEHYPHPAKNKAALHKTSPFCLTSGLFSRFKGHIQTPAYVDPVCWTWAAFIQLEERVIGLFCGKVLSWDQQYLLL